MKVPGELLAALAIAVAVIGGLWIAHELGFGKDPSVHCYGRAC